MDAFFFFLPKERNFINQTNMWASLKKNIVDRTRKKNTATYIVMENTAVLFYQQIVIVRDTHEALLVHELQSSS